MEGRGQSSMGWLCSLNRLVVGSHCDCDQGGVYRAAYCTRADEVKLSDEAVRFYMDCAS